MSRSVPCGSDNRSADDIRRAIQSILKKQPTLTDVELTRLLELEDIHIARRTVAKYRTGMGLQSSYVRMRDHDEGNSACAGHAAKGT